jgi:phosphomannomutase
LHLGWEEEREMTPTNALSYSESGLPSRLSGDDSPALSRIFKAYDIRGIYPEEINESVAYRVGFGYARSGIISAGDLIVLGRDMRESSDALFGAFAAGAGGNGLDIVDIGLCTTPMFYFAVNELQAAGGAMITASHNPGTYNGFKLVREGAIPIGNDSGLEQIKQQTLKALPRPKDGPPLNIHRRDVAESYAGFFSQRFSIKLEKPVIIDTGNGTVGPILRRVLRDQRINYRELFFEPDGRFPNHEANPLNEENLRDLRQAMAEQPGSIGVAFDGDGDRVCFLDEAGETVRGDLFVALLAPRILARNGGGKILYDLRSSRVVPDQVKRYGGEPIRTRVGHAFIKHIMREQRAVFGGELSYHFYFRDFFNCESGIYAMLQAIELLAESSKTLAELVAPLRTYAHSGEINFRVADVGAALAMVEKHFKDGDVSYLDGLSVDYPEWWFNLRPSNTEPLLRLNVEADNEQLLKENVQAISRLLNGAHRSGS